MRRLLFASLAVAPAFAFPAWAENWSCPGTLKSSSGVQLLAQASVWAGTYGGGSLALNGEDAEYFQKKFNRHLSRWEMQSYSLPRFLDCVYGAAPNDPNRRTIIVPIADDATTCELDVSFGPHPQVTVHRAACWGGTGKALPMAETTVLSADSAIDGLLHLRRSRQDLQAVVAGRGGAWIEATPSSRDVEVTIGERRYRVVFSETSGLSREIIAFAPMTEQVNSYLALVRQFGPHFTTDNSIPARTIWQWRGQNNIWAEHWPNRYQQVELIENHLIDMADIQSKPNANDRQIAK
ncbi:MAG: hypothetical protein HY985_18530 [Magnetospirillum sp.]|nr:hypothetical protein [Magnetospirillum sp.]